MNAFHRGQAIENLENLSMIIAIHCVLVASFPEHESFNHWNGELDGFIKALRRYDKGRKGRHNYSVFIVEEIISEHLIDSDYKEAIETFIDDKGFNCSEINWDKSLAKIGEISRRIFEPVA